jgi:2-oxoglutarate dehydrogenase E2 component (dihydrolipoamide succinyltransferase)
MDGIEAPANTIELTVPELGDLGERAIVAGWNKRVGERVTVDEPICRLAVGDLEFEVCSTADGEVTKIFADQGVGVLENTSLAQVRVDAPPEPEPVSQSVPQEPASDDASAAAEGGPPSPKIESIEVEPLDPEFAPPKPGDDEPEAHGPVVSIEVEPLDPEFAPPQPGEAEPPSQPDPTGPAEPPPTAAEPAAPGTSELPNGDDVDWSGWISPVVQALADEHDLNLGEIRGTGIGGRIRKRDVLKYLESRDRSF